jgi:hypothetical protein
MSSVRWRKRVTSGQIRDSFASKSYKLSEPTGGAVVFSTFNKIQGEMCFSVFLICLVDKKTCI